MVLWQMKEALSQLSLGSIEICTPTFSTDVDGGSDSLNPACQDILWDMIEVTLTSRAYSLNCHVHFLIACVFPIPFECTLALQKKQSMMHD